jgi:hypothetical protein
MRRAFIIMAVALSWAPSAGAQDASLALSLSKGRAVYGATVVASGSVSPAAAGEEVVIELVSGALVAELGRTATDAAGAFSIPFEAVQGGFVQARTVDGGALSTTAPLEVIPGVHLRAGPGRAFLGARLQGRVTPATYTGRASIVVRSGYRVVATLSARVSAGKLRALLPMPGLGRFVAVVTLPPLDGLSGRTVSTRVRSTARSLSAGAAGPDVRALTRRLGLLGIRVPGLSSTFSYELTDSVIAFQKAYRLARTGIVGPETWRALGRVQALQPRYRRPAAHIEVDKTRQILLDVRNGEVVAVLPVSSGATGNTPEGKHRIRWKALATTTWLGPAILYRTMTFYGNSFAIHGFPSVPAYPASHGCVRIPIWAADWLYDRSRVGETVYVYR